MAKPSLVARAQPGANDFRRRVTPGYFQQFQASYDQTAANYRQTALTAFQQVEDNLAALRILTEVIEQQDSAIESARRTLQEANVRYQAGIDPYLSVITAQTALLADQQAAVNFRMQRLVASVQLIKARGGGCLRYCPSSASLQEVNTDIQGAKQNNREQHDKRPTHDEFSLCGCFLVVNLDLFLKKLKHGSGLLS